MHFNLEPHAPPPPMVDRGDVMETIRALENEADRLRKLCGMPSRDDADVHVSLRRAHEQITRLNAKLDAALCVIRDFEAVQHARGKVAAEYPWPDAADALAKINGA